MSDHDSSYPLSPELSEALRAALGAVERRALPLSDGRALRYEALGPKGAPVVVLANGLGGRLYTWLPVVEALAAGARVLTWDYRGLFDSEGALDASSPQDLSVVTHAEDLARVLDAEGEDAAHLIGWSMGVQVSLEFAARNPARALSLTLINGTYGQVFSTAFQPLARLPLPTWALHEVTEGLRRFEGVTRLGLRAAGGLVGAALGLRARLSAAASPVIALAAEQYCRDLFTGEHLGAYLTLFQQLDAHSAYHLLPRIEAPTLVLSGGLDFLTPPYQSRQIARRMPRAEHHMIALGTHFVILERSREVLRLLRAHLEPLGVELSAPA